jgi:hypothetical protein
MSESDICWASDGGNRWLPLPTCNGAVLVGSSLSVPLWALGGFEIVDSWKTVALLQGVLGKRSCARRVEFRQTSPAPCPIQGCPETVVLVTSRATAFAWQPAAMVLFPESENLSSSQASAQVSVLILFFLGERLPGPGSWE